MKNKFKPEAFLARIKAWPRKQLYVAFISGISTLVAVILLVVAVVLPLLPPIKKTVPISKETTSSDYDNSSLETSNDESELASDVVINQNDGNLEHQSKNQNLQTSSNKSVVANSSNAFYVAPNGDDKSATGSINAPFKTPQRAVQAVKALKNSSSGLPKGGVTVYFRSGKYLINEAIELDSTSSGTASSPITYTAYAGESVEFTGGKLISRDAFVSASNDPALKNLIDSSAKKNILKIDLQSLGITDLQLGDLSRRGFMLNGDIAQAQLFVNDETMTLAQWPNKGESKLLLSNVTGGSVNSSGKGTNGPTVLFRKSDNVGARLAKYTHIDDIWIDGVIGSDWVWTFNKIKTIDSTNSKVVLTNGEVSNPTASSSRSVNIVNALEELDSAGEYYIDRDKKILYYYPTSAFKNGANAMLSLCDDNIISMSGVNYVNIENITLSGARMSGIASSSYWSADKDIQNVIIKNITVKNVGSVGIGLSGSNIRIENCIIKNVGDHGIYLSGGDENTLESSNNVVNNCSIHDISTLNRVYTPAVRLIGVGTTVENNSFYNIPHGAFMCEGSNHIIRNNAFYNTSYEFRDMGAIYVNNGYRPYQRGTVISNNYIKGTTLKLASGGLAYTYGVYLDNGTCGFTVEKNIIDNVKQAAIFVQGGGENITRKNIIKNSCSPCYGQNFYLLDWGNATLKGCINDWYVQKSKYAVTGSPYLRFKGLKEFYDSITVDVKNNILSNSSSQTINAYKNTPFLSQTGNTYTDTLLYNDASSVRPDKLTFFNATRNEKAIGLYANTATGDNWAKNIVTSNIKEAANNPFTASINGDYVDVKVDEKVIASSGITVLSEIQNSFGVSRKIKIGAN